MNELQIALAAIGVLIIVIVIVVNRFQERKYRKLREVLRPPAEDVLFDTPINDAPGGRVEPRFEPSEVRGQDDFREPRPEAEPADEDVPVLTTSDEIAPASKLPVPELPETGVDLSHLRAPRAPESDQTPARVESKHIEPKFVEPEPVEPKPAEPASAARAPEAAPDGLPDDIHGWVDYAVRVASEQLMEGAAVAETLRAAALGKPVRIYGHARQGWRELLPRDIGRYHHVCAAMQLADRNGAASREELEAFREAVKRITPQGLLKSADIAEAARRAADLDHFCVDVDVLIGVNIVAAEGAAFSEARIAELARGAGMALGRDGLYHLKNDAGETLFSLSSHEASPFSARPEHSLSTSGLTLLLDVPRVADGLAVFDRMVALGQTLARELGGKLVDDNIQPLSDTGIARIRAQLERIYALMDARGIPSGSALARRLFA
jgi:FtsZ-interacting cell division protein ZipA